MDERIETENGHVVMYRPTGPEEYQLVADSDFTKWPPRLEGQRWSKRISATRT